jgi:hypothetical protein
MIYSHNDECYTRISDARIIVKQARKIVKDFDSRKWTTSFGDYSPFCKALKERGLDCKHFNEFNDFLLDPEDRVLFDNPPSDYLIVKT